MAEGRSGEILGVWRLGQLIGWGGMGNVYLAKRIDDVVEQTAAVKILRVKHSHDAGEGGILKRLSHHNIARRIEEGFDSGGFRYLVMEYVDGKPITVYADQAGLSIEERLMLFRQACDAIGYLHSLTYLHMDIKPAHLLVTAAGVVKLIDFGNARRLENRPAAREDDAFSGPYASPEQIRPGSALGYASDVYSLGAVLYELLCGHPPFEVRGSDTDLDCLIREKPPLRPSDAVNQPKFLPLAADRYARIEPERLAEMRGGERLADLRKRLRGNLDCICSFSLRKGASRRYLSTADLKDDIDRVLAGKGPAIARSGDPMYSAVHAARRKPQILVAAMALLTAVVGGLTYPQAFMTAEKLSIEKTRTLNEAVDASLGTLRKQLRPRLEKPQFRESYRMLDAVLKTSVPAPPAKSEWQKAGDEWQEYVQRMRDLSHGKVTLP